MTSLDIILAERERLWYEHPIITESAIMPTRSVQDALARTLAVSRKARDSIAFWADPLVGKSSCLKAIEASVIKRIPGCGVLRLEAVEDLQCAEGRLLLQILKSLHYAHKVDSALAGKRDQVNRALIARAGNARHLFILIDEAQEFSNKEFAWLKAVINGLSFAGIKVTTVLFGQRELQRRRTELYSEGRSDLGARFMKTLSPFKGCRNGQDLLAIFDAMDHKSEFPDGSNWTYTQLLLPRAFAAGFRLAVHTDSIWEATRNDIPISALKNGIPMDLVAAITANLIIACKDRDGASMSMPEDLLKKAVVQAVK